MARARPRVGWREWIRLPDLGIERIAAKVDTGARTSVLHGRDIVRIDGPEGAAVEFTPPLLRHQDRVQTWQSGGVRRVRAKLVDERIIRFSSGEEEFRYVVMTSVELLGELFDCEFSLTTRARQRFPVLLGRSALRGRFLVDVARPRGPSR